MVADLHIFLLSAKTKQQYLNSFKSWWQKNELFTSFLKYVDKPVFGCKKLLSLRTSFFKPSLIFSWGFAQRKQSQQNPNFHASNISENSKTCRLACILLTKQKHYRHLIGPFESCFFCGKNLIFAFKKKRKLQEISVSKERLEIIYFPLKMCLEINVIKRRRDTDSKSWKWKEQHAYPLVCILKDKRKVQQTLNRSHVGKLFSQVWKKNSLEVPLKIFFF